MHEWSFARKLLQQATSICRENGATRCLEVRVQIGPLAGIEATLLESAFEQLSNEFELSPVRLAIEQTSLVVHCRDCVTDSELPDFDFYCRECGKRAVRVVKGDQLQLISVTLEGVASGITGST